jgi:hypothetical protein
MLYPSPGGARRQRHMRHCPEIGRGPVDEETYVWMLKATYVDEIALVNQRARVPYDHVVEAVPGESSRWAGR